MLIESEKFHTFIMLNTFGETLKTKAGQDLELVGLPPLAEVVIDESQPKQVSREITPTNSLTRKQRLVHAFCNLGLVAGMGAASLDLNPSCPADKTIAQAGEFADSQTTLNISTFNIDGARGNTEDITRAILSQKSDVVALQEVDSRTIEHIKQDTGFKHMVTGWIHDFGSHQYGLALMTNLPVLEHETYELPSVPFNHESRVLTTTTLDNKGQEVVVAGIHYTAKESGVFGKSHEGARVGQASKTIDILDESKYRGKDVVLAGDFNTTGMSKVFEILGRDFRAANEDLGVGRVVTFPFSSSQYDFVLLNNRSSMTPQEMTIFGGESSNHCGVTVKLASPPADAKKE